MVNYYTETSFIFPLEKDQAEFAMGVLDCLDEDHLGDLQKRHKTKWAKSIDPEMLKCAKKLLRWLGEDFIEYGDLGFVVDIDEQRGLWIRSDETCVTENAAIFIRLILNYFDLDIGVCINAAHTCSKLRLDAFGGHAAFVTKTGVRWMSTDSFLHKQVSAHQKRLARKAEAQA